MIIYKKHIISDYAYYSPQARMNQIMNTLLNRNVTVNGRRTSMRLEQEMWDALQEICRREAMSVHEVCSLIDTRRGASSLTASTRVFILMYFRTAAAELPLPPTGTRQGIAVQLLDKFRADGEMQSASLN